MNFDDELLDRLRNAERVVFFTGAGASQESGIPTFREDENSLWGNFDPRIYASPDGFDRQPEKVWQWYSERRRQLNTLQPNPTHHVIAAWQQKAPHVTVVTQNIDGFHQQAGSLDVIELHGSLTRNKCRKHGHLFSHDFDDMSGQHPHCTECGSLLRPDVVWFNEVLPEAAYERAESVSSTYEVFFSIGCSMDVYPANVLPYRAKRCGAYLVQINPEQTDLDDYADCNLHGKSGEVLPALWQAVWEEAR